ncbi:hypothetical protein [Frigoriflavimonas asaccharolytica]|uniref:Uncharacterized protein n=1 Tax=Frigoriflavimonas asaccharolytica TaxID=2735899 RepID=A0A8J8GCV9_9FLAO|nr:hypothetical protein [Frigoriflavimonas asaccharolytica]NRS94182.1 hypothetical protein [Frigoriflavimonas asaccharolytica]
MIITILIILGIIIFFFLKDRDKSLENQVDTKGGIRNKYKLLVEFLSNHPNANITKITRDYIKIDCIMQTTSATYEILQNFNQVEVFWYSNLGLMGQHKLKWSFNSNTSQEQMIEKIHKDLNDYEERLF